MVSFAKCVFKVLDFLTAQISVAVKLATVPAVHHHGVNFFESLILDEATCSWLWSNVLLVTTVADKVKFVPDILLILLQKSCWQLGQLLLVTVVVLNMAKTFAYLYERKQNYSTPDLQCRQQWRAAICSLTNSLAYLLPLLKEENKMCSRILYNRDMLTKINA